MSHPDEIYLVVELALLVSQFRAPTLVSAVNRDTGGDVDAMMAIGDRMAVGNRPQTVVGVIVAFDTGECDATLDVHVECRGEGIDAIVEEGGAVFVGEFEGEELEVSCVDVFDYRTWMVRVDGPASRC